MGYCDFAPARLRRRLGRGHRATIDQLFGRLISVDLVNLGKYVSAMLAAGTKVAYEKDTSLASLSLLVAVSSTATVYQLYWDFVKDWGLLLPGSKNPWLRDELILKRKSVYYLSMGLNLVLRLAWLQTVIHPNFGSLDSRSLHYS